MVIAGPVFTEGYWGPLFFLGMFSPLLAGGTTAVYLGTRPVARRRGWERTLPARALRLVVSFLLVLVLTLLGAVVWSGIRFERAEARDAREVRFVTFEPRAAAGFHSTRAEVFAGGLEPSVHWIYERDGASLLVAQQRPRRLDLAPPTCSTGGASVTRYGSFEGECTARRTPSGREVLLAREADPPHDRYAFTMLGGTLVAISTLSGSDADLLAFVDALDPVDPREIDFKR
jgi:hypothetical protein